MTYLQQTIDFELGTNETFKKLCEKVDIIWWACFDPNSQSFNYINKDKVVVAAGYLSNGSTISKTLKKFKHFYFHQHLTYADCDLNYLEEYEFVQNWKRFYPREFSNHDLNRLLADLVSRKPISIDQFEKQSTLYKLNYLIEPKVTPLEEALIIGKLKRVKNALSLLKNNNEQLSFRRSFFRYFIHSNCKDTKKIVELLIANGVNLTLWSYLEAVSKNLTDIATMLVDYGATENYNGRMDMTTPFHKAIYAGNQELTNYLIQENHVSIKMKCWYDTLPVELAAWKGWTQEVNEMCDRIFGENESFKALHIKLFCMVVKASKTGALDNWMKAKLERLEQFQGNSNKIVTKNLNGGYKVLSPFSLACENGNIQIMKYFLNVCNANPNGKMCREKHHKSSPIGIAAANGQLEAVKLLLEYGVDVNSTSSTLDTPLLLACLNNHYDVAEFLLENQADIHKPNILGVTCLMASIKSSTKMIELLINIGAEINARDKYNRTALHHAIQLSEFWRFRSSKILLDHGADPFVKSDEDGDALEAASNVPSKEIFDYLISKFNFCPQHIETCTEQLEQKMMEKDYEDNEE